MDTDANVWRKCSRCKKPIDFLGRYFVCSVSTCNGLRTGYVFCSVACWETHLPGARHRDAAAVEKRAPSRAEAAAGAGVTVAPGTGGPATANQAGAAMAARAPMRMVATATAQSAPARPAQGSAPREILIVASKLKDYIRARSEMNTSAGVMEELSEIVRRLCDDAIDSAREDGRKTVMERDFKNR